MLEIPPIFRKARFHLPKEMLPPVVIKMSMEKVVEWAPSILLNEKHDAIYPFYWIESDYNAFIVLKGDQSDTRIGVMMWHPKKKVMVPLDLTGFNFLKDSNSPQCVALTLMLAFDWYVNQPAEISVNTKTRNKPSLFVREGDKLIYSRIEDVRSHAGQSRQRGYEKPAEPSGIHKRQHDVRGHWREYSSGVRVYVKSHQRGDPALGRVTRIIT
jgi:hypothetical protein